MIGEFWVIEGEFSSATLAYNAQVSSYHVHHDPSPGGPLNIEDKGGDNCEGVNGSRVQDDAKNRLQACMWSGDPELFGASADMPNSICHKSYDQSQ